MLSDQSICSPSSTMESLSSTNAASSSSCSSTPTTLPSLTHCNNTAMRTVFRPHCYKKVSKQTGEIVEYIYEYPHVVSDGKRGPKAKPITKTEIVLRMKSLKFNEWQLTQLSSFLDQLSLRDSSVANAPSLADAPAVDVPTCYDLVDIN
eukprot:Pompholyxophrys_punicea_v1_NODE_8_length_8388_cov_12.748020.p6 type:complete len:149 gc:universal NODE_8_length_8388_cov_12.748020:2695-3141(+)